MGKNKYGILITIESNFLQKNDIQEMYGLIDSAGYTIYDEVFQKIDKPHHNYFLGPGKTAQIQYALFEYFDSEVQDEQSKVLLEEFFDPYEKFHLELPDGKIRPNELVIIFNNRVRSSQKRELSRVWAVEVLDRDDIILEIFEKNAKTRQSKLQIELAKLKFRADIVKAEFGEHVDEKQGRDFRGKGRMGWEPKYRAFKERRRKISEELGKIQEEREIRRKKRDDFFNAGIIGYTNAGKSTLLNSLTKAEVETADEEFTTVSTTSRKITIPDFDEYGNWNGQEIILTDSVGFIQNMSPIIFDAFISTLEELRFSDIILFVVDISEKEIEKLYEKMETTFNVIEKIGANTLPKIIIFNKIDLIEEVLVQERKKIIHDKYPEIPIILISALKKEGLEDFKSTLLKYKKELHVEFNPVPEWKKYLEETK